MESGASEKRWGKQSKQKRGKAKASQGTLHAIRYAISAELSDTAKIVWHGSGGSSSEPEAVMSLVTA